VVFTSEILFASHLILIFLSFLSNFHSQPLRRLRFNSVAPPARDSRHSRHVNVNHHWHNPCNLWYYCTQITPPTQSSTAAIKSLSQKHPLMNNFSIHCTTSTQLRSLISESIATPLTLTSSTSSTSSTASDFRIHPIYRTTDINNI
jgi:hypothetical protein